MPELKDDVVAEVARILNESTIANHGDTQVIRSTQFMIQIMQYVSSRDHRVFDDAYGKGFQKGKETGMQIEAHKLHPKQPL